MNKKKVHGAPCPNNEKILIFLAKFSIWPAVFRIDNIYFKVVRYVFLIIMAIIFFRRIKRIRTYTKKSD